MQAAGNRTHRDLKKLDMGLPWPETTLHLISIFCLIMVIIIFFFLAQNDRNLHIDDFPVVIIDIFLRFEPGS